jgi:CheY-like chemotaxis protein
VHEHLVTIRTVALDAAVVIKRLQALKRGTKLAPDRSPVDLAAVATTMREISRPRWERSADHPGPAMTVNVRALDVPTVLVIPAEVRELLLNLIFNAIDAMPSGGTITITTKTGQDGWAEVLVEDTGIGMSAEVLGRIFEPFFSTKGAKGSGLGLSVSRTIAQRYGGTLTATSMVGVGTTFTLRLPPAPASSGVGTESVQASAPVAVRTPVAAVARPQGRRVLLVDDQVEVLMVVSRMLRSLGHDVVTAGDGPAALSAATQGAVDLVLTDYHMPGMNGGEVASRLQRVAPTVPVVIFSGSNLSSTPLPSNVQRALGKPLTMDTLGEVVGACANAGVHA